MSDISLIVIPRTAAILPFPIGTAACIAFPLSYNKYKDDENNISHECWDKLWKDARCTTNPPKMEDHKNLTLKEVRALTDEYASKNNKIYRQACYGDESKYPAVRLYVTDKKNLRDGNYTPINFSVGVHSTHNFIVNSIIISPDHKVSIYKNNDLSGYYTIAYPGGGIDIIINNIYNFIKFIFI